MLIQYDGTRYDGWQKQGNTGNTIQAKIEQVLERMTGKEVEIHGSGRTDAGVHALGQVANAHLDTKLSVQEIRDYVNRYLPEDILVLEAEEVSDRFHSRLNASEKIYTYYVDMAKKSDVFKRKYVYTLGEALDVNAMKTAAGYLCGTHDFKSFCTGKTGKKSTVRTIWEIHIQPVGSVVEMRFCGNGFLYNMVRILSGTLIEVGMGKREPESMAAILDAKDRQQAGFTAPAEGLFLTAVHYGK
jgi:tRNA pseudouridine38-40 synthase